VLLKEHVEDWNDLSAREKEAKEKEFE